MFLISLVSMVWPRDFDIVSMMSNSLAELKKESAPKHRIGKQYQITATICLRLNAKFFQFEATLHFCFQIRLHTGKIF